MKKKKLYFVQNDKDEAKNIHSNFVVEANAIKDQGDGLVMFSRPVTITDTSEQWNGTKYDLKTFDIAGWNLLLTADHSSIIQKVLGKVIGLKKVGNNRVTIDGIVFATKQNPLADYAYNMMLAGYLTDFSIETIGPWPDDEGIYHESKLVGCSVVVAGNNKQAHVNEIAMNAIKKAEENGLDASTIKEIVKYPIDNKTKVSNTDIDMFKEIKNTRDFAVTLNFKDAAGNQLTKILNAGEVLKVSEDQEQALNDVIKNAVAPKAKEEKKEEAKTQLNSTEITEAIQNAVKPFADELATFKKNFNTQVKEPVFTKSNGGAYNSNKLADLDYRDRHDIQINAIIDFQTSKGGDRESYNKLIAVNQFHVQELAKAKKVRNSMTISDFGNFVISPELLTDIEGYRSDFKELLAAFGFRETLSTRMAFLKREGDINMQEVAFCDDGANGNLKPISEYEATIETSDLQELAAVTPICNAATRFLAVDMLGDVAEGYRTDYDRKKSQLIIARLQQAVNETNNKVTYDTTTDLKALQSWIRAMTLMQQGVMNGVYIFNQATYGELLLRATGAGVNTDGGFKLFSTGDTGPLMLGRPYIIVPNELMPTLNTAGTKSFTVEGATVTITAAVFYADPRTWSGRTSGGLNYDVSVDAAYEQGGVVKSAWQRNEVVLRGSFFRGGVIRDTARVVAISAPGVS